MSFTQTIQAPARLNRSELAVPGSSRRFLEKAAASAADVVFLDLEDSVTPDLKEEARQNINEALRDLDWGKKTVSLRVNGLDTPWMYRDVIDVLEKGGERLDLIMLPKVGVSADVYMLDALVSQIEMSIGREKRIGFELIIESALGLSNASSIAAASSRTESLHFGVADFAASVKADTTQIGGPNARYAVLTDPDAKDGTRDRHWGDPWHYPIWQMVIAARAHGLRPIDGPFGDFSDEDGYRAQAERAMVLGCEGKWAIHPSQIALANAIYTPAKAEVEKAQRILNAMEEAKGKGAGAVSLDGKLIDLASIRQAQAVVEKAQQCGL